MTVGVQNTVLQNEGIYRLVLCAIIRGLIILNNNSLVVAIADLDGAVHILGCQHTDLGHRYDGAVCTRGGIEGIEQAVQLFGHDDQSIGKAGALLLFTAGKATERTQKHEGAKEQRENSLFHFSFSL